MFKENRLVFKGPEAPSGGGGDVQPEPDFLGGEFDVAKALKPEKKPETPKQRAQRERAEKREQQKEFERRKTALVLLRNTYQKKLMRICELISKINRGTTKFDFEADGEDDPSSLYTAMVEKINPKLDINGYKMLKLPEYNTDVPMEVTFLDDEGITMMDKDAFDAQITVAKGLLGELNRTEEALDRELEGKTRVAGTEKKPE